jgi:phenylalanyl-tRNA synthetase alpha chain
MEEQIAEIKKHGIKDVNDANNLQALNDVRVKYLGKKGELTLVLRGMGSLTEKERPIIRKPC